MLQPPSLETLVTSPLSNNCVTVVSIIGTTWQNVRHVCNLVAGRSLLPSLPENDRVNYVWCDSVLYLISLDVSISNERLKLRMGGAGIVHTSNNSNKWQGKRSFKSRYSTEEAEAQRITELLFLFTCSHIVLLVNESDCISLKTFRTLSILRRLKDKQLKKLESLRSPLAWPGSCVPWTSIVFLKFLDASSLELACKQGIKLLHACGLSNGNLFKYEENTLVTCCKDENFEAHRTKNLSSLSEETEPFTDGFSDMSYLAFPSFYHKQMKISSSLLLTVQNFVRNIDGEVLNLQQWLKFSACLMKLLNIELENNTSEDYTFFQDVYLQESSSSRSVKTKSFGSGKDDISKPPDRLMELCSDEDLLLFDSYLNCEEKLLKCRCSAALPIALNSYRNNIPTLYNSKVHTEVMKQAILVFRGIAGGRGSICRRYEARLIEQCKKIWQNPSPHKDRRLCDNVSLTGRSCILLRRECIGRNGKIDPTKCRSGVLHKLYCSCGKSPIERSDPFDSIEGNGTAITLSCCKRLHSMDLNRQALQSRFQQYTLSKFKPRTGIGGAWVLHYLGSANLYDPIKGLDKNGFSFGYNYLELWKPLEIFPAIHIGLEYVCYANGRRLIFPVSRLKELGYVHDKEFENPKLNKFTNWIDDRSIQAAWPPFDTKVFIASSNERKPRYELIDEDSQIFQLNRLWIHIERLEPKGARQGLIAALKLEIDYDYAAESENYKNPVISPIILKPDSFYCCTLPRIFAGHKSYSRINASKMQSARSTSVKRGFLRILQNVSTE